MNGISNIFIHKVLSLAQVAYYNGVYSSDCLNKYLKQEDRFVIVCNMSPAAIKKGSHFITMVKHKETVYIFDSLSIPLSNYPVSINQFLSNFSVKLVYDDPIQSVTSSFCGFYCILFAILSDPEYQDVSNLKMFRHKKLEENDDICIENILKLLNK